MLGYRLVGFVSWLLDIYMWIIIISALLSWVNPDPYNPIVQFFRRVTEPVLRPIRRMLAAYRVGIDISPLIAILLIQLIQRVLLPSF